MEPFLWWNEKQKSLMENAKANQTGAGTNQIMRLIIFRGGLEAMGKELKMPSRRVHEKLKVPIATIAQLSKPETSEDNTLKALAEDYQVNQAYT